MLTPKPEQLAAVVINGKFQNPALTLLKRAVKLKKSNNYRHKLPEFAYTKYVKFLVGAETDRIKQLFDTVYVKGKIKTIDSSLYKLKKDFSDKDFFLMEHLMKVNVKKGQAKTKVIATRTAGFKQPLYEMLALQVSELNVYDDYYKFLFQKYLGPFSRLSEKEYKYEIDDTLSLQNRLVIAVSYQHTKKPFISGKIFLDKQSLAIAKFTINAYKDYQLKGIYNFTYYPQKDVWFPNNVRFDLRKAEKKDGLSFGGGAIQIKNYKKINDSIKHTNDKTGLDYTYGQYFLAYKDVLLDRIYQEPIKYNFEIAQNAAKQKEEVWQKYTGQKHSQRALNTYKYMDSIFESEKVEANIYRYKRLMDGYYPLTHKIDLDIVNLFDYNRYEGFRMKIGARTNENFSEKLRFDAYAAFGFRDKAFKYHLGTTYKLHHQSQTYLKLWFTDDLDKTASFPVFQKRSLFMMPQHLADNKFFRHRTFGLGFEHLLTTKLKLGLNMTAEKLTTSFDVPYHKGRIDFKQKDEVALQFSTEWTPFAQYYLRPEGRTLLKDGYPKFYVHFQTNFPQWQTDITHYYRISAQALFKKQYLNKNLTELFLQAGFVTQNPGINHLFSPATNNYPGSNPFARINLEKKFSFETMRDLEFADNFLLSGFLQHTFTGIHLSKKKQIDIRLSAKAAWGLSYDSDKYVGIQSLDKIYYETGFEVRRILGNLGLGFYYRLGDYAYPGIWDNLSVRLTLNPFKLFGGMGMSAE